MYDKQCSLLFNKLSTAVATITTMPPPPTTNERDSYISTVLSAMQEYLKHLSNAGPVDVKELSWVEQNIIALATVLVDDKAKDEALWAAQILADEVYSDSDITSEGLLCTPRY